MSDANERPDGCTETLPDFWWRDKETLRREYEAHGTWVRVRLAHPANSPSERTLIQWWGNHGLPHLPKGPPATPPVPRDEPVDQTELLRLENQQLRRALGKAREGDVEQEQILTRLEDAIEKAGARQQRFRSVAPPASKTRSKPDTELALLFSDAHASEIVRLDETEGMNSYDWAAMERRIGRMIEATLSHRQHFSGQIDTLHLWMLGDMLSGDIHHELSVTNDRTAAEAIVDFGHVIADVIEKLAGEFRRIIVHSVPGNHPRFWQKPHAKLALNNGDWLTYRFAELLMRDNNRVEWHSTRGGYLTAMVCERWRVLLMHGDGIRTTMPGVPWGGVTRRVTTLEAQFQKARKPIDYVAMGHFHTVNQIDGIGARTFLNGSLKGLDEWSLKQFGHGRDASQLLLAFHQRHGWTGSFPLDLQDKLPAGEGW